jgi:pantetheine-phosphate adenylyltransferase
MQTLVFPGTFDPITNSHVDLARRARGLFDRVIVAVGTRGADEAQDQVEDRAELCRLALQDLEGVEVDTFDGLLVDYVRARDARFVLRGMRTIADFEYEFQRVDMTRVLAPEIEFVFLAPSENCAFVSSTLVREIAAYGGDITDFVPPAVADALARRMRRD